MRKLALAAGATVGMAILAVPGVAFAHHVILDFSATGAQVPGGDPDGTATGAIDFNDAVSDQMCLTATAQKLSTITGIHVVKQSDNSVLVDFGTSLNSCVTATTDQMDALHDFSDEYRIVIETTDYPEGAVAGLFVERPPTTTTSSTTSSSSTSTTSTIATTSTTKAVAVATTATPRFTG